jgi:NADH:ubiquinone oxidoreductase subunit K
MMHPGLTHYLAVAAALFGLGLFTAATRRSPLGTLFGLELVLNAAGLNLVAFDRFVAPGAGGRTLTALVIALAACETALAVAIVVEASRAALRSAGGELGTATRGGADAR